MVFMNRMNIGMLSIMALILLVVPFAFAQESGTIEAVSTRHLGSADQKHIDKAINYIKEKLGGEYYTQYLTFQSGDSYEDCTNNSCTVRNEISFDYNIPFDNSANSRGPPVVRVTMDKDGNITGYFGPIKPYEFLISEERTMELAKSYGIKDITTVEIAMSIEKENGYELVWAVGSNDLTSQGEVLNEPLYRGVYVDVDDGEIKGEYKINPMIQTPSGSGGVILGEFFDGEENDSEQSINGPMSTGLIVLLVIVVLAIVLFAVYRVSRR